MIAERQRAQVLPLPFLLYPSYILKVDKNGKT